MSERTAKVLLASVILARSSSYVLQKISLTDIDVFNLMGIRFLMAFLIMLLIFNKKLLHADKASIAAGLAVGTVYFVVMSFEVFSLKTCESSTTAFVCNIFFYIRNASSAIRTNGLACDCSAGPGVQLLWIYFAARSTEVYLCRNNRSLLRFRSIGRRDPWLDLFRRSSQYFCSDRCRSYSTQHSFSAKITI